MQRPAAMVLLSVAVPVLLGGCRVEQTPEEYFDHASSLEEEREAAEGEVRDRLLAFVGAAGRGDAGQAVLALNPREQLELVAPAGLEVGDGRALRGLVAALVTTPVAVRVQEVEVETGPAGGVAWFRMVVEAPGRTSAPSLYRATGTYVRDAGVWELVQAHVSGPVTTDSTSSPPDSAATAAEGE